MSKKKKTEKARAQRAAKRAMRRHNLEASRRKKSHHAVISANAIQHQMLGQFGNVENFLRNVKALGEMFRVDPDLAKLRFDPAALNSKFDPSDRETNRALRDLYVAEDVLIYSEEFEGFWRDRRKHMLPELITDELVKSAGRTFDVLLQKKRGFKREYRAALAGKLLVESHAAALTEADVEDNNLWELIFNATLKENKIELPELPPEPAEVVEPKEAGPIVPAPVISTAPSTATAAPEPQKEPEQLEEPVLAAEPATPEPIRKPAAAKPAKPMKKPEAVKKPKAAKKAEPAKKTKDQEKPKKASTAKKTAVKKTEKGSKKTDKKGAAKKTSK